MRAARSGAAVPSAFTVWIGPRQPATTASASTTIARATMVPEP